MMTILATHIRPSSSPLSAMNHQYPHYTNAPALTGGWNPQSNSYASSSTHQFPNRFQTPHLSTTSSVAGTSHGSSFAERGYIANMFGPASRTYWGSVLKASPEHLHLQTIPGPSPYWRISPQDHSAGIQNAGHVLDYILDVNYVAGPVVPQQLWQPLYKRIREVLVENSRLCMPIFFIVQETGRVGLSLSDALAKKHYLLHGHNQAVDLGGKVTTHIRILWKGYVEYKRQIQIQDQTRDRNPITLGRLVEHVARTVQRFIERPPQRNEDDFDPRWTVGPHGITINDIVLVGIVHSSAGTWQPILRLSRPLPQLAQAFASPVNQQALHSNTYIQTPSPEFSFDYPGDNYHYSGHAPSPEQFTTITHTPSPPHHQYPSSYPSSPNLQVLSTDGMYLAPSPPYSAYPST